jgi:hypothetical protein
MKRQIKFQTVILVTLVALAATALSAFAAAHELQRAEGIRLQSPAGAQADAQSGCTKMTASDVAWVTLNEDGDIDEQVDFYPSGAIGITPVFEYDCVPKKTTIVTIFSLDGEQVYSDKESLKASSRGGTYGYPLATTDESPMDEGEWGVEFYNNKTLLTESAVIVGDEGGQTETVTVIGTVKDAKTKKAIKGAVILVLAPGVLIEDFIDGGQADEDIYTGAKTDSKGRFELEDPLEREVEYSFIVVAKGYQPIGEDGIVIPAEADDPVELPITLSK